MVYYPIKTLVHAGIDKIPIAVSEPYSGDLINVIRNGEEFGIKKIAYAFQNESIKGISGAISCGEIFAEGDSVAVILGDNTTDADLKNDAGTFESLFLANKYWAAKADRT